MTTANEVLNKTYEDHNWKLDPPIPNSTDGIQRMLTAHGDAIKALADHIDGVKVAAPVPAPAPAPVEKPDLTAPQKPQAQARHR